LAELVDTVDLAARPDIEVAVAARRGIVIAVRGDADPLAVNGGCLRYDFNRDPAGSGGEAGVCAGEGDELGDFFTGRGIPEAGGGISRAGKRLFPVRAKRYGTYYVRIT
jgi:hypothetical protein